MKAFVKSGLLWLTLLTPLAVAAESAPTSGENSPAAEVDRLQARLAELEALLSALDNLIKPLTRLARTALEQADMAPTFEERARHEQLYIETSARLGELQATRDRLQAQMNQLATRLRNFSGGE